MLQKDIINNVPMAVLEDHVISQLLERADVPCQRFALNPVKELLLNQQSMRVKIASENDLVQCNVSRINMMFAATVNFVFEKSYLRVLSIPEIVENIVVSSSVNNLAWIEQNYFSSDLQ